MNWWVGQEISSLSDISYRYALDCRVHCKDWFVGCLKFSQSTSIPIQVQWRWERKYPNQVVSLQHSPTIWLDLCDATIKAHKPGHVPMSEILSILSIFYVLDTPHASPAYSSVLTGSRQSASIGGHGISTRKKSRTRWVVKKKIHEVYLSIFQYSIT